MKIYLYTCNAENKRIMKNEYLGNRAVLEGTLKDNTDVLDPLIEIEANNLSQYNYMYIPEFHRFYFIKDIENRYNRMWAIRGHVDVLYTYAAEIFKNQAVIDRTAAKADADLYLDDGTFITDARKYTQVIPFQHGLDETPHTILIAAGGEPAA